MELCTIFKVEYKTKTTCLWKKKMGKEVKAERNSQEAIFTAWTSFWGRGLGLVRNPKKSSLWRPSRVNNILVCFVMGIVYKLAWQPPSRLLKSSTLFLRISVLPPKWEKSHHHPRQLHWRTAWQIAVAKKQTFPRLSVTSQNLTPTPYQHHHIPNLHQK